MTPPRKPHRHVPDFADTTSERLQMLRVPYGAAVRENGYQSGL